MARPNVDDWRKHEAILKSDRMGFNPLRDMYGMLVAEYPWLSDWKLGFCSKTDVPEWRSEGWVFLEVADLGDEQMESFNEATSLRFGLTSSDGHVRWRDNYLMIMPTEFRKKQVAARSERSERQFRQSQSKEYVAPGDARGSSEASYEEGQAVVNPDGKSAKRRRGRPPGKSRL